MKFNWGTGIAIFYSVFAISMLTLVVKSTGRDNSLVQENYYEADLAYQQQYDKISNAQNTNFLKINHQAGAKEVTLSTITSPGETLTGNIVFFRPSNKRLDFELPIALDASGQQLIPLDEIAGGRWRIKIDYRVGELAYYSEAEIII